MRWEGMEHRILWGLLLPAHHHENHQAGPKGATLHCLAHRRLIASVCEMDSSWTDSLCPYVSKTPYFVSSLTSFEVWTSTLYFISRGNTSDFSNTRGHLLSDNHVKTDIFPHNNYSAAEVQPAASYLLRRDEAYIVIFHRHLQSSCIYEPRFSPTLHNHHVLMYIAYRLCNYSYATIQSSTRILLLLSML